MTDMSKTTERDMQDHVLPQDHPVAALNILRKAAGMEPWPDTDDRPVPDLPRHQ